MVQAAVEEALVQAMLMRTEHTPLPKFRGKPSIHEGNLRLWCEGKTDMDWLKGVVATITVPGDTLMVARPEDVSRKVSCGILIPGTRPMPIISGMLRGQNPWAQLDRWSVERVSVTDDTFVMFGLPEDLVPIMLQHERRMSFLLGSVYVRFRCGKKYQSTPPPLEGPTRVEDSPPPVKEEEELPAVGMEVETAVDSGADQAETQAPTTAPSSPIRVGDHPELDSDGDSTDAEWASSRLQGLNLEGEDTSRPLS